MMTLLSARATQEKCQHINYLPPTQRHRTSLQRHYSKLSLSLLYCCSAIAASAVVAGSPPFRMKLLIWLMMLRVTASFAPPRAAFALSRRIATSTRIVSLARNMASTSDATTQTSTTETSTSPPATYPFQEVETKWQAYWDKHQTFKTPVRDPSKDKKYVLDMFPYPSGAGLHVGHPEGYTASDVMARYWRMKYYDVLHPIGWDSFGLPAEQFAIQTGAQPVDTTAANIANFKRQLKMLGFSYDWEREIATTDVDYVKWTQWIFLQLYEMGLAQQSSVSVNWCPALGTVLANEEVINGLSERGNHPVQRLPLRQWVLKITNYADRLEAGLDGLDWPSGTLTAQQQWIGKSQGCNIDFQVEESDDNEVCMVVSCGALFVFLLLLSSLLLLLLLL